MTHSLHADRQTVTAVFIHTEKYKFAGELPINFIIVIFILVLFFSNTVWTRTDECSVLWRWCIRHDTIVSPACGIKDLCFKQRVADNVHKNTQLTTQGALPVSHSKTPSGGSVFHTNTHDIIHQHPGSPTRVARLAMSDPIAPIVTCDQLVINLWSTYQIRTVRQTKQIKLTIFVS